MYKYILTLPCLFNNPTIVVRMSVHRNGKYFRKKNGGIYDFEEESISRLSKYNGFLVCFILISLIGYVNCSKDFSRSSSFLPSLLLSRYKMVLTQSKHQPQILQAIYLRNPLLFQSLLIQHHQMLLLL